MNDKKKNIVRKIYDWVLGWAETPYGIPALVLLSFAESSFFPIPPDVLLIALALAIPKKSFKYAFYAALASVIGGMLSAFGVTSGSAMTSLLSITVKLLWIRSSYYIRSMDFGVF